ncbi:phage terminase large subunit family protein [Paenibacillus psychroresistens]|uniref:Phage terminase large subunit family protein n=1 Tax=Paenibacillus psychroresistens TaxID=1778678 RepID=A0A6B8RXM2_9BACL|nr:phage terminase large subunit family protein [Paenibacillus psychroresistens]
MTTVDLFAKLAKLWAPTPNLTISEWADRHRFLTSETSAEPGLWRTERVPYLRVIMDSVTDRGVEEIVIMASAQISKTEFMLNMVGYHIDVDPAPILFMLPNKDLIESFSKKRLATMITASPRLRNKVSESKSRDASNTISEKSFPGGYIAIVGANSPASLSSRPIRIVLCDEVDRYPVSSGTEGDPIALATKRSTTFRNRKHVFVSTPTLKESSRIEQLYNDSTMEEWNMHCPSCDGMQPLKWAQVKFKYEKSVSGEFIIKKVEHACKMCGALHNEKEWKRGVGEWIAHKEHSSRRGFHLNQLISPWSTWTEIVKSFLIAKRDGPEKMKVWINTVLGETWEEEGEQVEEEQLLKRCEGYPADVPDQVAVLTAAVDVQDDRFEIEVVGWGQGKESWGIFYHKIFGDLRQPKIWQELDEFLSRSWSKKGNLKLGIACVCVDSGGHFTQEVYRFCAPRESRRIFAIKGQGTQNGEYIPLINGNTRTKRERAILFNLGVDEGKGKVLSSLKINEVGPGFCHFPLDRGYNGSYFKGLTAEKLITRYKQGIASRIWKQVYDRNEPLDLRVYNTAALEILNPKLDVPIPPEGGISFVKKQKRRGVISKGL